MSTDTHRFFIAHLQGVGIIHSCDYQSALNKNNYENSNDFDLLSISYIPYMVRFILEFIDSFNPENNSFSEGKAAPFL